MQDAVNPTNPFEGAYSDEPADHMRKMLYFFVYRQEAMFFMGGKSQRINVADVCSDEDWRG